MMLRSTFDPERFHSVLNDAFSLNNQCIQLWSELSQFIGNQRISSTSTQQQPEVEFLCVNKLTFGPISKTPDEQTYVMKIEGAKKKQKLPFLRPCFSTQRPVSDQLVSTSTSTSPSGPISASASASASGSEPQNVWKNRLRTPLPEYEFFDFKSELEVYEMLDPRKEKSLEELSGFVDGLRAIHHELSQTLGKIKSTLGLGEKVMKSFNQKVSQISQVDTMEVDDKIEEGQKEVYLKLKEKGPYVKKIFLQFQMSFNQEKSVTEFENFEVLVDNYFEVIDYDPVGKKRKRVEKAQDVEEQQQEVVRPKLEFFADSSVIEKEKEKELLTQWLKETRDGSLKTTSLLFRGSRDGFANEEFHKHCDSKGSSVVIFRTTQGNRAGGYSHVSWTSDGEQMEDKERKSFLFSFDHESRHEYNGNFGIPIAPQSGPKFGAGFDLCLASDCNVNQESYSLPCSYNLPSESHLAGSKHFQVADYEVWKIE